MDDRVREIEDPSRAPSDSIQENRLFTGNRIDSPAKRGIEPSVLEGDIAPDSEMGTDR